MTEILAGIYFDVDVPLQPFATFSKVNSKKGIESTGKVWREWRDQHYPSQNLSDLIEDLFNGNWKVVSLTTETQMQLFGKSLKSMTFQRANTAEITTTLKD